MAFYSSLENFLLDICNGNVTDFSVMHKVLKMLGLKYSLGELKL